MSLPYVLNNYHAIKGALPSANDAFVRDYHALKENSIRVASGSSPLSGIGSPERVITSNASMIYFDLTGAPTSVNQFVNPVIGATTGWITVL